MRKKLRRWWEVRKLKLANRLVRSILGDHHASFVNLEACDASDQIRQLIRWVK